MNLIRLVYERMMRKGCFARFEDEPSSDIDATDFVGSRCPVVGYTSLSECTGLY